MKRLARRTAMIERSTARRTALNERRSETDKKWEAGRSMIRGRREVIDSMVSARQRRREHWELGSALAPNRDHVLRSAQLKNPKYQGIPSAAVIAFRDDGSPFGAIGQNRYQPDIDATEEAIEARCAWAGGIKYLCLAPGDRVVITEGPYKGKIGPITALDKKQGAVQIESIVLVG
jgi:large subunit ribosomal protein L24